METLQVDAEEQELRDLGRQQDLTEGRPVSPEGATKPEIPAPPAEAPEPPPPSPETTPQTPDSEPEPTPPAEEPQPQAAELRERDERGRFKAAEAAEAAQQENGQAQHPEPQRSPYAEARDREARERERKDRSWSALQSEKDAFREQQAQWQDQRRMEQLQAQSQMPPLQKDGIDLQGYHNAYLDFRQRGDYENAMKSLETVLELEGTGRQYVAQQQEAAQELSWRNDMESAIQHVPELMDPDSPLTQETDRIISEHPYLFYIPQGFHKAVEIAMLLLGAGSDSELREENEQLRAQIEEYQSSSQPARGGPGKPPKGPPSRQEDMSKDEEEAYLRDLTRREDAMMGR